MKKSESELFIINDKIEWEEAGKGVQRKILGYNKDIMMLEVDFKKGGIGYLHKHPHKQVTYIIAGKFEVQIGNETKILRKGDCYIIPSDIEHGVIALEDSKLVDVFTPCREDFLNNK
jgi:Uncharacterized conserved protein, contains double-stranded beta-helix domain